MLGKRWMLTGLLIVAVTAILAGGNAAEAMNAEEGRTASNDVKAAMEGYRLGAGDVISISVWKNADLTREVLVLPDGTITFPLIGRLDVAEMTLEQLTKTLQEKIAVYSPDPQISVEVQHVNSLAIYVVGRVNHADRFLLSGSVNVLQALAMANGLTPFAKRAGIKIFRKDKDGTKVFPFNYDAVTEDNATSQNIELKRGDVVVVP